MFGPGFPLYTPTYKMTINRTGEIFLVVFTTGNNFFPKNWTYEIFFWWTGEPELSPVPLYGRGLFSEYCSTMTIHDASVNFYNFFIIFLHKSVFTKIKKIYNKLFWAPKRCSNEGTAKTKSELNSY